LKHKHILNCKELEVSFRVSKLAHDTHMNIWVSWILPFESSNICDYWNSTSGITYAYFS